MNAVLYVPAVLKPVPPGPDGVERSRIVRVGPPVARDAALAKLMDLLRADASLVGGTLLVAPPG